MKKACQFCLKQILDDKNSFYCSDRCGKKMRSLSKKIYIKKKNTNYCDLCGKKIDINKSPLAIYCSNMCSQRSRINTYRNKHGEINYKNLIIKHLGEKCIKCKSDINVRIYYIKSIKYGGKSEISNLHLLCSICKN